VTFVICIFSPVCYHKIYPKHVPLANGAKEAGMIEDRKGKRHEDGHGVYEVENGTYHCSDCHYEVPLHKDCPHCQAHIDWGRVLREVNH